MIAVIDYGMGNVGSILNMLRHLGTEAVVTSDPRAIQEAEKLVLPGVGSFDAGMDGLRRHGLLDALHEAVHMRRRPILGICLGMQLFSTRSEEGAHGGLGWIPAETRRLPPTGADGRRLLVPHMGWNTVESSASSVLFAGADSKQRFYFVHSYHVVCRDPGLVAGITVHGIPFTAAIEYGNIYGTQFHPEKSHRYGMQLLKRFVAI